MDINIWKIEYIYCIKCQQASSRPHIECMLLIACVQSGIVYVPGGLTHSKQPPMLNKLCDIWISKEEVKNKTLTNTLRNFPFIVCRDSEWAIMVFHHLLYAQTSIIFSHCDWAFYINVNIYIKIHSFTGSGYLHGTNCVNRCV